MYAENILVYLLPSYIGLPPGNLGEIKHSMIKLHQLTCRVSCSPPVVKRPFGNPAGAQSIFVHSEPQKRK